MKFLLGFHQILLAFNQVSDIINTLKDLLQACTDLFPKLKKIDLKLVEHMDDVIFP